MRLEEEKARVLVTARMGAVITSHPAFSPLCAGAGGCTGEDHRGTPPLQLFSASALVSKGGLCLKLSERELQGAAGLNFVLPRFLRLTPLSRENSGSEEAALLVARLLSCPGAWFPS